LKQEQFSWKGATVQSLEAEVHPLLEIITRQLLVKTNFENKMEKAGKGHGAQMSVRRQTLVYSGYFYLRHHVQTVSGGSPTFSSGGHLEFLIANAVA
jgi:hypothetical protein